MITASSARGGQVLGFIQTGAIPKRTNRLTHQAKVTLINSPMKRLLALLLLAFAFNVLVPDSEAAQLQAVAGHKKHHKRHHHRHHHHHHHHHRKVTVT